jgi:hypothetical protein
MQTQIVKMINDFEHGRLSREQLIATASRTTIPPMPSRDSKPPALRPGAKAGVCISTIRTGSNVRSPVRD